MATQNTCSLYVKGMGYSLESYRLDEADAHELHETYKSDPSDFINGPFTSYADIRSENIKCDYISGVDPLDISCRWDEETDEPNPAIKPEAIIRTTLFTDDNPKHKLEYHQICYGKMFGNIELPISHPSEYDPDLLKITYVEFAYEGWPERYGRIISSISYDDQEVEMDWEHNGLDVDDFLLGYKYNNNEFEDYVVIYESHAGKILTDFQWDKLEVIFD